MRHWHAETVTWCSDHHFYFDPPDRLPPRRSMILTTAGSPAVKPVTIAKVLSSSSCWVAKKNAIVAESPARKGPRNWSQALGAALCSRARTWLLQNAEQAKRRKLSFSRQKLGPRRIRPRAIKRRITLRFFSWINPSWARCWRTTFSSLEQLSHTAV